MEALEPSRWCRVCGKALTNPVSIQLGMGPVCYPRGSGTSRARRRTRHPRQERAMPRDEHGRHRAAYAWSIDGQVIVVVDLDQGRSVTNDAGRVIQDLVDAGVPVDQYGILCLDATGRYDGLATRDGQFAGFVPLGRDDYAEARELLLEIRRTGQAAARMIGEILPTLGGGNAAVLGETLCDVLNPGTWRERSTNTHSLTPGQEAERGRRCGEPGRTQRERPPERAH